MGLDARLVEGKSTEELLVRSSMPAEVPKLVVQEEVEEGEVGKAVASRDLGGGGEMMPCPEQLVSTEEQGQHEEKNKKQGQVAEPVQTMTLVGRHVEKPKEHVERAMDARGMWRPLSKQQT